MRLRLIPIRDITPRLKLPLVSYLLIAVIGLVFWAQVGHGQGAWAEVAGEAARDLAADPTRWRSPEDLKRLATSLFLHAGWLHVFGNLGYLFVFGDHLEDRMGHFLFLLFFVTAGGLGLVAQGWLLPADPAPILGTTAAVTAVLTAYAIEGPMTRVVTLFPVLIFLVLIEVPAVVFLGVWVVQERLYRYLLIHDIAWPAANWPQLLSGLLVGGLVGLILRLRSPHRPPSRPVPRSDTAPRSDTVA